MHHEVLKVDGSQEIDPINSNGLDNRKCNLRLCNHRENIRNARKRAGCTSRYKGVHRCAKRKKWKARIYDSLGKSIYLSHFESELDAAAAYDERAKLLFGDFALPNLPAGRAERGVALPRRRPDPYLFE